jgi:hypothetical protein
VTPSKVAGWARHAHGRNVLEEVLRVCAKNDIPVAPVKGIVTGRWLYEDPSERWIQDIDLRIAPTNMRRMKQAGESAGWRVLDWSPIYRNLLFRVNGMMVELEAHIGPRGVCDLSVSEVLSRAKEQTEPFGFSHMQLEIHDHALLLILNAFKDKVVEANAGAIQDLERIAALSGFDPSRLAALAARTGVATIAFIVGDWLVRTRGAAAWRPVLAALGRPPRATYARLFEQLMNQPDTLRFRLLARAGSDRAVNQALATSTMVAWVIEQGFFRLQKKA